MFHCCAYNLRIASDLPLPELPRAHEGGDVEIRLAAPRTCAAARSIQWRPTRARFDFPGAGRFLVAGGEVIEVIPEPPEDLALLRLYVQGMMLAALLDQRGYFVLHASVVEIDGRCVAFVGPVGAGKSTMAAALHARGRRVIADDNAAIELAGGATAVAPGFPNLKVYPEIARVLGFDVSSLRVMHDSQQKQAQHTGEYTPHPAPLAAVYVLDRAAAGDSERLSVIEAVTELIRHSVPTRWGVKGDAAHLAKCAQLAARVPLFRVRTFRALGEIAEVATRLEDHCLGLMGTGTSAPRACRVGGPC